MKDLNEAYQDMFEEVRKAHNRLRWVGDMLHDPAGISSAMRSLLLSLQREGPCTVPDLARERLVSRQIIQTQVNALLEQGLVVSRVNPRHRRSRHLDLTRKGRQLVKDMQQREEDLIKTQGSPLSLQELRSCSQSLKTLREHLEKMETVL